MKWSTMLIGLISIFLIGISFFKEPEVIVKTENVEDMAYFEAMTEEKKSIEIEKMKIILCNNIPEKIKNRFITNKLFLTNLLPYDFNTHSFIKYIDVKLENLCPNELSAEMKTVQNTSIKFNTSFFELEERAIPLSRIMSVGKIYPVYDFTIESLGERYTYFKFDLEINDTKPNTINYEDMKIRIFNKDKEAIEEIRKKVLALIPEQEEQLD